MTIASRTSLMPRYGGGASSGRSEAGADPAAEALGVVATTEAYAGRWGAALVIRDGRSIELPLVWRPVFAVGRYRSRRGVSNTGVAPSNRCRYGGEESRDPIGSRRTPLTRRCPP